MALFTPDPQFTPPKKERKNKATPKPPAKIWETYKEGTLAALTKSLEDAQGRWEQGRPRPKYTPSQNWTIKADNRYPNGVKNVMDEVVDISYKVGQQKRLDVFPGKDGKTSTVYSCTASGVIPTLKSLIKETKSMTKTSEWGRKS